MCIRDRCVLDELGDARDQPLSMSATKVLVRNVQYATIARLRGRSRWRSVLRGSSIESALARTMVLLLRALSPQSPGGVDQRLFDEARGALPASRDGRVTTWGAARDLVVREWADAHPLVGLLA